MKGTKNTVVKSYLIFTVVVVVLSMALTSVVFFPSLDSEPVIKTLIPIRIFLNILDLAYLFFSIYLLYYVVKKKLGKIYIILPAWEILETMIIAIMIALSGFLRWNLTKISSLFFVEGYITGFIVLGLSLYLLLIKK